MEDLSLHRLRRFAQPEAEPTFDLVTDGETIRRKGQALEEREAIGELRAELAKAQQAPDTIHELSEHIDQLSLALSWAQSECGKSALAQPEREEHFQAHSEAYREAAETLEELHDLAFQTDWDLVWTVFSKFESQIVHIDMICDNEEI